MISSWSQIRYFQSIDMNSKQMFDNQALVLSIHTSIMLSIHTWLTVGASVAGSAGADVLDVVSTRALTTISTWIRLAWIRHHYTKHKYSSKQIQAYMFKNYFGMTDRAKNKLKFKTIPIWSTDYTFRG